MSEKRFIIDVEDEFQENAVFFGDEFLCFEDDSESLVSKLNEQQAILSNLKEENEQLEKGKMEALSLLGEEIDKNEQLKQKLENLDLNEKNDTVKMIDGKVFIKM